jgi:hypothetical protein
MISIEQLCEIFNQHFTPPRLPEGLVDVSLSDDGTLLIHIAGRDVEISEDGDVLGCGGFLPADFDISKIIG